MTILDGIARRAEEALDKLRQRAADEGWDTERIEHEKDLFGLSYEVSLCQHPGCLVMVNPIPGFLYIKCDAHAEDG